MTTAEFLSHLRKKDVRLWVEDDRLRVRAPEGTLTPGLREQLADRKSAIVELLRSLEGSRAPDADGSSSPVDGLPRVDRNRKAIPASFAQRRLWFVQQMDPDSAAYNEPRVLQVNGPLDETALRASIDLLVRRHEPLRTTLPPDPDGGAEPVQQIHAPTAVDAARLPVADLMGLPASHREQAATEAARQEAQRRFELSADPPFRARLLRLSETKHQLLLTFHHTAHDAQSLEILLNELCAAYASFSGGDVRPDLSPLPVQYADYAAHQRALEADGAWDEDLTYWTDSLEGVPSLDLLPDPPRARTSTREEASTPRGASTRLTLEAPLVESLRSTAAQENTTLFASLLTGLQALVYRHTGQTDFAVAVPTAGRDAEGLSRLVGCFINPLALRADVSGRPTFRALLRRVRESLIGAQSHAAAPFERVVDALDVERTLDRHPVAQVAFAWQDTATGEDQASLQSFIRSPQSAGPVSMQLREGVAVPPAFDLMITGAEVGGDVALRIEYDTRRFASSRVERLARHWKHTLKAATAAPDRPVDRVAALPSSDCHRLLNDWGDGGEGVDPQTTSSDDLLPARVAAQARRTPDRVAAVGPDGGHRTYAALDRKATAVAGRIRRALDETGDAVDPDAASSSGGDVVGILMQRTPEVIVAMLAVWRVGAAYLPLDPEYPNARLRLMLADSGARLVCTDPETNERVPAPSSRHDVNTLVVGGAPPDDASAGAASAQSAGAAEDADGGASSARRLAYLIYTSGSTGRPKGVEISHAAALNFLEAMHERPGLDGQDRMLALTTLSFDISLLELIGPLLSGGRIEIAGAEESGDGVALRRRISATGASTVQATPATWQMLTAAFETGDFSENGSSRASTTDGDRWPARALSGGEALTPGLAGDLTSRTREVWNLYGPTEATVWATATQVRRDEDAAVCSGSVSIGTPLRGVRAYVLDEQMRPVPPGARGNLYLGGVQLARGYRNRPRKTAAAFVPNPFSDREGDRLYRTGDRARWTEVGELAFWGRTDRQVKVRGHRIELGEIEAHLSALDGVRRAAVTVYESKQRGRDLAAHVEAKPDAALRAENLRSALAERLPAYMVPGSVTVLDDVPLTPNNKIDRDALPAPDLEEDGPVSEPETPTERRVARIWRDVLGIEEVGRSDNFFARGGHSLLAMKVVRRIEAETNAEVAVRTLFEHPTVQSFAREIAQSIDASVEPDANARPPTLPRVDQDAHPVPVSFEQRRLWLLQEMEPESGAYNIPLVLRLDGRLDVAALRRSLRRLIRRHEVLRTTLPMDGDEEPVQVVHSEPDASFSRVDLSGLPAEARSRSCMRAARHEAQRPFDLQTDRPVRARLMRLTSTRHRLHLTLHHAAVDGWSVEILLDDLLRIYDEETSRGRTQSVNGTGSGDDPPPVRYVDYAAWQRGVTPSSTTERVASDPSAAEPDAVRDGSVPAGGGEQWEDDLRYWTDHLDGVEPLDLPTDRPRAASNRQSRSVAFEAPPNLSDAVRTLAADAGATPFVVLLTAVQVLMQRYTHQCDFAVGVPVDGRDRHDFGEALRDVVGCFVDTLALRADVGAPVSAHELVRRVRATTLSGREHRHVPFDAVVDALGVERKPGRHPVAQVAVSWQDMSAASGGVALPDIHETDRRTGELDVGLDLPDRVASKFDLVVQGTELDDRLGFRIEYDTGLFDTWRIDRLKTHLLTLLDAITSRPDQPVDRLPVMGEEERSQVLFTWPTTRAHPLAKTARSRPTDKAGAGRKEDAPDLVPYRIASLAIERPDRIAVTGANGGQRTYESLRRRALRVARHLRAGGIERGDRVGVLMDRTADLPAVLLGVWQAGAAYVPLDPAFPDDRIRHMLADSSAEVVVHDATHSGAADAIASGSEGAGDGPTCRLADTLLTTPAPSTSKLPTVLPGQTAYVIYTSGSTGTPKGVLVPHRNVAALLDACSQMVDTGPDQVWASTHAYAFDFSVWEMWGALYTGGCVSIIGDERRRPDALAERLVERRVTLLSQTPSSFSALARTPAARRRRLDALQTVVFGGEELRPERLAGWIDVYGAGVPKLVNMYGITETTVHVTHRRLHRNDVRSSTGSRRSPVGRALPHLRTYVVDDQLRPVPAGVPGEICVAGAGLARSYLNRPRKTAEAFVPNPFASGSNAGRRLYRTGDRARWTEDGELEYLGRIDRQVQVRGYRVEPGEVEARLEDLDGVDDAVVVVRQRGEGTKATPSLLAYVVPATADEAGSAMHGGEDERRGGGEAYRDRLAKHLPDYMVPDAVVTTDEIPLTPTGKVDRDALPAPADSSASPSECGAELPAGPVEAAVADIWRDVLDVDHVDRSTSFFDVGGHSLLATQVASRLRRRFDAELSSAAVFEAPTVRALAKRLKDRHGVADEAPPEAATPSDDAGDRIPVADRSGGLLPTSFTQRRLWLLQQMRPDSGAYNVPRALRLAGDLDPDALETSLSAVVERHKVLRTTFPAGGDGEPSQRVHPTPPRVLARVDLTGLPAPARRRETDRLVRSEGRRPFDLPTELPLRAVLLRRSEHDHVLSLVLHHVATDGWSMRVLFEELSRFYRGAAGTASGERATVPSLPVQYADYAAWQRRRFAGEDRAGDVDAWAEHLRDVPMLDLPTDRPRPATRTMKGATVPIDVPPAAVEAVRETARGEEATLFMAVMAALQVVLARYSRQDDFAVGVPVARRDREEIEPLIGAFVNTLALRSDVGGNPTVRALLRRVRRSSVQAQARADVPFERVVEALDVPRDLQHHPVFQVMLAFDDREASVSTNGSPNAADDTSGGDATEAVPLAGVPSSRRRAGRRLAATGLDVEPVSVPDRPTKFDLTVRLNAVSARGGAGDETAAAEDVSGDATRLRGTIEYATDLFSRARIERMTRHLQTVLEAMAAHPDRRIDRLPLQTDPEREALLTHSRGASLDENPPSVPDRLDRRSRQVPDRVATVSVSSTPDRPAHVTYAALRRRAGDVAHAVQSHLGATRAPETDSSKTSAPETNTPVVGLLAKRTGDVPAALWGIRRAGAAVLPLDPSDPADHIAALLQDSGASLLVVDDETASEVLGAESASVVGGVPMLDLSQVPAGAASEPPPSPRSSGDDTSHRSAAPSKRLSYLRYTSGTTGAPKGVGVSQAALATYLTAADSRVGIAPGDRCALIQPAAFDASITTIYGALCRGATLVIPDRRMAESPAAFEQAMRTHRASYLKGTPSHLHTLLADAKPVGSVRTLVLGGEALPEPVLAHLQAATHPDRVLNQYGPTEAVVGSVAWVDDADSDGSEPDSVPAGREGGNVPIGEPLPECSAWVVDENLRPVPVGVPGELCLGGDLARGYRGRPRATAECFVPNPFADEQSDQRGARMYRTGDRVRWAEEGTLQFLGRADRQVQLRGRRIELGAVEARLEALDGVDRAAARMDRGPAEAESTSSAGSSSDSERLVAYVTGHDVPGESALRTQLAERCPAPLVPDRIVLLDTLPLTPNGKVDYAALPQPESGEESTYEPPQTPVEEAMAEIWADVLDTDRVGRTDDFFRLGGHSLLAMRMRTRIEDTFGVDLPLRTLFETPTLRRVAARVAEQAEADIDAAAVDGSAGDERSEDASGAEASLEEAASGGLPTSGDTDLPDPDDVDDLSEDEVEDLLRQLDEARS
jgi:amino acid adenylation domain-containing protein